MRNGRVHGIVAGVLVLTALCWAAGASAQSSRPQLEFVAPETVAISGSGDESDPISVWLRNDSGQQVTPRFVAVLENSDGHAVEGSAAEVVVVGDEGDETNAQALEADSVGRYRLEIHGSAADDSGTGQLVAEADGIAPGSVALTVGPKSVADKGVDGALLIPLAAAFVLMVLAWLIGVMGVSLRTPLPALDFDFKTSFASTLTAVGALLGTIIAAGVLPENTVNLSKDAFTALNLLYGVAIVAAGIVYLAAQKSVWVPKTDDPKTEVRKQQGFVGLFLVATTITVWAVLGELWTTWLLVDELGQGDGFSALGVVVFKVLLGGAALAMASYTIWRIKSIVSSERPKPTPKPKAGATKQQKAEAVAQAEAEANDAAGPASPPAAAEPERISLL